MFPINASQLSAESLSFTQEDVCRGSLILVNKDHPLKKAISENTLTDLTGFSSCELVLPSFMLLEKQAATMLSSLLNSIGCGYRITGICGYRSHKEQTALWENNQKEQGNTFAQAYVARPGCSEHETGLAIDLAASAPAPDFIRPDFPDTGICGVFRQKAPRFGFVERYPREKEKITGISFEPWHFRYVGFPHSAIMVERNLTLEEYLEMLEKESSPLKPFFYTSAGTRMELMYLPIHDCNGVSLEFSDSLPYTLSGTNKNGVILTRFRRLYEY